MSRTAQATTLSASPRERSRGKNGPTPKLLPNQLQKPFAFHIVIDVQVDRGVAPHGMATVAVAGAQTGSPSASVPVYPVFANNFPDTIH